MARIYNIKRGTLRSTTRVLPKAIDKDHRIRMIGGNTPLEPIDNSICNGTVSCPNNSADTPVLRVGCNSIS